MRSTRDNWSRERRVVGKAEWTDGKANPRFVAASLAASAHDARSLDEDLSCQRGEMENRIEECQLDPFAAGASAHGMRANQLRLWFASMAYVLLCAVRRLGLAHTRLAVATCGNLRLELLKIAAWVRIGVRRIEIAMDMNPPFRDEFRTARRRSFAPQPEAAHSSPFPSITETSPNRTIRRQPTGPPTRPENGGDRANRKITADTTQRPSNQRRPRNPG